ncbi:uncharacterized protein LOC128245056 [Mya arenaria]|uniref:uncharacterized protein LOC128245056 n=1 Tax=Mya arenaria TaxID=6604 RepID=UPI0022E4A947|nr:uncharacterized protein LOC128245056 [Mya arenaria]
MWNLFVIIALSIFVLIHNETNCTCVFQQTNQTLQNLCDWSDWLPWNCTDCHCYSSGDLYLAKRQRGLCCNKLQPLDECLNDCGFNQGAGAQYQKCSNICTVSALYSSTDSCLSPSSTKVSKGFKAVMQLSTDSNIAMSKPLRILVTTTEHSKISSSSTTASTTYSTPIKQQSNQHNTHTMAKSESTVTPSETFFGITDLPEIVSSTWPLSATPLMVFSNSMSESVESSAIDRTHSSMHPVISYNMVTSSITTSYQTEPTASSEQKASGPSVSTGVIAGSAVGFLAAIAICGILVALIEKEKRKLRTISPDTTDQNNTKL